MAWKKTKELTFLAYKEQKGCEIDQLVTPIPSPGLEFWVHRSSSLVFTVLPKDGYRLVSMVLKTDMSDFVFGT